MSRLTRRLCLGVLAVALVPAPARPQATAVTLAPGDRLALVGNTLAERQQLFNHFETQLLTGFPEHDLIVRNLGWSADTLTLQPRPLNFGDAATHLTRQQADVIVAFFGLNESFEGEAGLERFSRDLDAYLAAHQGAHYNGTSAPKLVLVSPIAHERLPRLTQVDVDARNRALSAYTEAMRRGAASRGVVFVDLFTPTLAAMRSAASPLTINGIHVNEDGDRLVARLLLEAFGVPAAAREATPSEVVRLDALRERIRDKNQQFFYRWRPVNAEYIVGRRVEPFGAVNFPGEMKALEEMVAERERAIQAEARVLRGLRYPSAATPAPDSAQAQRGSR